jgi:hypothetical protein
MSEFSATELTYAWLDSLFSQDPSKPGSKIADSSQLVLGPGVLSTEEEDQEREQIYTFQNIQNAYRVLSICSMPDSKFYTESLLHAHAETFLKKAYAAWNLSGVPRLRFENSLKTYVNTTLAEMFQTNAPVCREGTNEILALQDMHQEVEECRRQNLSLKETVREMQYENDKLREALKNADLRDVSFAQNLSDSIEGATLEQRQKYQFLTTNIDAVIAAAVVDTKSQLGTVEEQLGQCQFKYTVLQSKLEKSEGDRREQLKLLQNAASEMTLMQDRLRSCGQVEKSDCSIQ